MTFETATDPQLLNLIGRFHIHAYDCVKSDILEADVRSELWLWLQRLKATNGRVYEAGFPGRNGL